MEPRGTITPEVYGRMKVPSAARRRFDHDKQEHRVYTIDDINEHTFTDDQIEYINAAIDDFNKAPTIDLHTQVLFGLLQKLQDYLKMDDSVASKLIIVVSNNSIDEMHKNFDMNSFYAGAAWYSRELAKNIYELIDDMKEGD